MGLEPTKIGFAGQRLDHFGIDTSEKSVPVSAHYSMPRTMHCEPLAAAKRFSARPKRTQERWPFTSLPGIDAMAPCANRTFAAFTCASHLGKAAVISTA